MYLCKLLEYVPVKQFTLVAKEEAGVKMGYLCERALVRAKYVNLTRKEWGILKPFMEDQDLVHNHNISVVVKREKLFKLATVYFKEETHKKVLLDIHYHLNRSDNGYRDEKQLFAEVEKMLYEGKFEKNLIMGAYSRRRGQDHKKVYTKIA